MGELKFIIELKMAACMSCLKADINCFKITLLREGKLWVSVAFDFKSHFVRNDMKAIHVIQYVIKTL